MILDPNAILTEGAHYLAQRVKGEALFRVSRSEPREGIWQEEFSFEANPGSPIRGWSGTLTAGFSTIAGKIIGHLDRGLSQRIVFFDMTPHLQTEKKGELRVCSCGSVREVSLALLLCVNWLSTERSSYRFVVRYTTEMV